MGYAIGAVIGLIFFGGCIHRAESVPRKGMAAIDRGAMLWGLGYLGAVGITIGLGALLSGG